MTTPTGGSGSDPFESESENLLDQLISGESAIGAIPPFEGVEDGEEDDGRQAGSRSRRNEPSPAPISRTDRKACSYRSRAASTLARWALSRAWASYRNVRTSSG